MQTALNGRWAGRLSRALEHQTGLEDLPDGRGRGACAAQRRRRDRPRRDGGGDGLVRVREIHAAEHRRHAGSPDQRHVHPGRSGRLGAERPGAGPVPQPEHRLRVPAVQPAAPVHRPGQRRAAHALRRHLQRRAAAPGDAGPGTGGAGRPHAPPAQRTVGRAAAARVHRPGPRAEPGAVAGGRADRRPGHRDHRADHGSVPAISIAAA